MINKIKKLFDTENLDYLIVNNTNEWLEETPDIKESSVYLLTGFKGDTGDILINKQLEFYLFVDGRYHIQAEHESKDFVKIIKLQQSQRQDDEICKIIKNNSNIGFFSKKISFARFEKIKNLLISKNVQFTPIENDIIDNYNIKNNTNLKKTGCTPRDIHFKTNTLITNLENVSYLTQYRNFDKEGSSKIYAKLFINKNGEKKIFFDNNELKNFLMNFNEEIMIEKNITMYDFSLLKKPIFENLNINIIKSIKTYQEIQELKKAFEISDKSLLETRDFINSNDNLSEFDIYNKLQDCFFKNGATGLSFRPIVAINQNSALAHYNQYSKNVKLKNGDLVLIDCGIYTKAGLATDTTRVFIKGEPNNIQKEVYTLTLKAFLNCYNETDKTGYELNELAHNILDNKINVDNNFFVFNHGLGHGIGISVHENPPSLGFSDVAKNKIENGMCFTIEPGLYHKNYFGIRLENSFYRYNNKNISFNKIGFEQKLINFASLTKYEKEILTNFALLN